MRLRGGSTPVATPLPRHGHRGGAPAVGLAAGRDARVLAERLIATADGIAIQAMFDPASWPSHRQRAALDEALLPLGI